MTSGPHQRNIEQARFLSLPSELLSQVAAILDWPDLLHLRMVCKTLHDVSKLRSVRINLVHAAIVCNQLGTSPERPIEDYTDEELECWAMRRLSVDRGWHSNHNVPIRSLGIDFSSKDTEREITVLVEGGRWLLTTSPGGLVKATDLENPGSPATSLIYPQEDITPSTPLIATAICDDSPLLTFYLALIHCHFDEDQDVLAQSLQFSVWRVALSTNGSELLAQHVNSFHMNFNQPEYTKSILFTTELFSRISVITEPPSISVEVHDWKRSNFELHCKASFRPALLGHFLAETQFSHILPNNRIIAITDHALLIFKIPELESCTPISPGNQPSLHPIQYVTIV